MKKGLKKVLALTLSLVLVMALTVGCGKKEPAADPGKPVDEAKKMKVAVILQGAISDMSWNATAYNGLKKIEALGAEISYQENVAISTVADSINTYATEGYNLIFLSTNGYEDAGAQAAPQYPDTQFILINGKASHGDNLISLQIADDQQGFLMGAIAALTSTSKSVGFIGGEEITPIINGKKGFEQGVKYVDPSITVNATLTGNFDNVNQAKETAKAMIETGVDVVAPMANAAALGVLEAAEESGTAKAVGSSVGQEKNAPKSLLIGIGKDTSIAYEAAYKKFIDGTLGKDVLRMGAAEGVVFLTDWYPGASDGVSADVKAEVKKIYDELAGGKITIDLK
ncbi:MAG: basic rane lipoprotein [Clostridiales bacterium]|jgi:basic membrane protein A|nr:basic rane lipoprotein [Clostridiales bacterium]